MSLEEKLEASAEYQALDAAKNRFHDAMRDACEIVRSLPAGNSDEQSMRMLILNRAMSMASSMANSAFWLATAALDEARREGGE